MFFVFFVFNASKRKPFRGRVWLLFFESPSFNFPTLVCVVIGLEATALEGRTDIGMLWLQTYGTWGEWLAKEKLRVSLGILSFFATPIWKVWDSWDSWNSIPFSFHVDSHGHGTI